jgi:hypothetical protein
MHIYILPIREATNLYDISFLITFSFRIGLFKSGSYFGGPLASQTLAVTLCKATNCTRVRLCGVLKYLSYLPQRVYVLFGL